MALTGFEELALYGFLATVGALVVAFIISEVAYIFGNRQSNESFSNAMQQITQAAIATMQASNDSFKAAMQQMTQSTIAAIEAIKDMAVLGDAYSIASQKTGEHIANANNNNHGQQQAK